MNKQTETAIYILDCYRRWKKNGEQKLPEYFLKFSLKNAGYNISQISKYEIIFSYLLKLAFVVTAVSGITGFVLMLIIKIFFNA